MNPKNYKEVEASAPANSPLPVSKITEKEAYGFCANVMEEYEFGSDAYMDAWTQLEQIKNRNGGMPPV